MTNIFFDLDGTIIDSRNRLYTLFQELVPQSALSFDAYWDMKRNKINHQQILSRHFPAVDFDAFNRAWLDRIESPEMLALDTLYPNAAAVLRTLKKSHSLYVLTARQSKDNLIKELTDLGIIDAFNAVLLTEHKWSKEDLIGQTHVSEGILIGDTGYDIQTAKACGLKSVAITHGFLSADVLRSYEPDKIIHSLSDIKKEGIA